MVLPVQHTRNRGGGAVKPPLSCIPRHGDTKKVAQKPIWTLVSLLSPDPTSRHLDPGDRGLVWDLPEQTVRCEHPPEGTS